MLKVATMHQVPTREPKHGARLWKWIALVGVIFLVGAGVAARLVIDRAQPIVSRAGYQYFVESLRRQSGARKFSSFRGSRNPGFGKWAEGFGKTDPNPYEPGIQPLIAVAEFSFQSSLRSLFRSPMHVNTVYVKGLELNIPPKQDRQQMTSMSSKTTKMTIVVDEFVCEDTKLVINTPNPEKPPLEFAISNLKMKDIGQGQPLQFNATLVNPKPVGDIQSTGLFGTLATRQSAGYAGARGLLVQQCRPEHD